MSDPIKHKDCPALLPRAAGCVCYMCPVCGVLSGGVMHPPVQGIGIDNVMKQISDRKPCVCVKGHRLSDPDEKCKVCELEDYFKGENDENLGTDREQQDGRGFGSVAT